MPSNRFSIYDAMERAGRFRSNSANADSQDPVTGARLYTGPVEYPKMFYHPEGEERITSPGEEVTRMGRQEIVGRLFELIYQQADNPEQEETLRAEGWHDHPAKAIRARVELVIAANPEMVEKEKAKLRATIPPISSDSRIKDLEAELARITAERDAERESREQEGQKPVASAAKTPKPVTQPAA